MRVTSEYNELDSEPPMEKKSIIEKYGLPISVGFLWFAATLGWDGLWWFAAAAFLTFILIGRAVYIERNSR